MMRFTSTLSISTAIAAAFLAGCSDDGATSESDGTGGSAGQAASGGAAGSAGASAEDYEPTAEDFTCLKNTFTKVGGFYVKNELGHLDEAIAVAESPTGGTYPPGTFLQLVPAEAMVKRGAGFSPESNDWEFFFLGITPQGSIVESRGVTDVVNSFGGNCFNCHRKAEPQWDFVCETDHGCDPLMVPRTIIDALVDSDQRCQ